MEEFPQPLTQRYSRC